MYLFIRNILLDQPLLSKAKVLKSSLEEVLRRVQWSGKSALQKQYNKQIIDNTKAFESVALCGKDPLN